jgi:hypothetical protein
MYNNALNIGDIPTEVLLKVYSKWYKVKRLSYRLTEPCAMCYFIEDYVKNNLTQWCFSCDICPLGDDNDGWCNAIFTSKVNVINNFVSYIEDELLRRYNE